MATASSWAEAVEGWVRNTSAVRMFGGRLGKSWASSQAWASIMGSGSEACGFEMGSEVQRARRVEDKEAPDLWYMDVMALVGI